jgi:hypothetical protein
MISEFDARDDSQISPFRQVRQRRNAAAGALGQDQPYTPEPYFDQEAQAARQAEAPPERHVRDYPSQTGSAPGSGGVGGSTAPAVDTTSPSADPYASSPVQDQGGVGDEGGWQGNNLYASSLMSALSSIMGRAYSADSFQSMLNQILQTLAASGTLNNSPFSGR